MNWDHASTLKTKRVLVDSGGETFGSANFTDGERWRCDVCGASDKAPRIPTKGTPIASVINEKLQLGFRFRGGCNAAHAMDVFARFFLLITARPENPPEARDAFCSLWVAISGRPK